MNFNKVFYSFNAILFIIIFLVGPIAYVKMFHENKKCVKCIYDSKCRIYTLDDKTDKASSVSGKYSNSSYEYKYFYYKDLKEEEKKFEWLVSTEDYRIADKYSEYTPSCGGFKRSYACSLDGKPRWEPFSERTYNWAGEEALITFLGFFINFCLWLFHSRKEKKLAYFFISLFFLAISLTSFIAFALPVLWSSTCAG